jgi:hypothetical protein
MPLQATSGAASYDAFGGGLPFVPTYIEDVFSTWLYTGNGSSQSITNGIDVSGKGGLVWIKQRNTTRDHLLFDTSRGATQRLFSNLTLAQSQDTQSLTAFNANGFSVGSDSGCNINAGTYASWTFRKQPKFFDVVTYTGNGASSQAISHSLGSTPGCVIVKRTDSTSFWLVWHRGFSSPDVSYGYLNSTDPFQPDSPNNNWAAAPTSTTFTPASNYNVNGATYVAYLFAHNAGGFGLTGTDNVISCGSYTTNASGVITSPVNLGYEPQWILSKRVDSARNWQILDVMRGDGSADGNLSNQYYLYPNLSDAEGGPSYGEPAPTATGFTVTASTANSTYIYIAIRRGPMKTPTSGTSVFDADTYTGDDATSRLISSGFAADAAFITDRTDSSRGQRFISDRLRGGGNSMATQSTTSENGDTGYYNSDMLNEFQSNSGILVTPNVSRYNSSGKSYVAYQYRRAPGFFDEVCYTSTGSSASLTHNLGVPPELVIFKCRSTAGGDWIVYWSAQPSKALKLNDVSAIFNEGAFNNTAFTSTTMGLAVDSNINSSTAGRTYVAYLFATCLGVSKVGSYTGNGSSQTINCGFTGGARFVMIKRTDSTGDWYVWDTARGIVANNDPHLSLNSTDSEVTTDDTIDTDSTGFVVNQVSATNVNVSSATYIYLAIA